MGRRLRPSAGGARTTHSQFPTVSDGYLMSVRDDRDSGYVGSTRSQHAAWSQRSQRATVSDTYTARFASGISIDEN